MVKRLFDIVFSFVGLIILSPFFLFIALAVIFESKGGAFYRQVRVGRKNTDFKLFKFRSMYVDADKKGLLTVGNRDYRITRVGYYLRKFKLDELPQLVNVLKGDMSFVGPRPEVRKYVNLYSSEQLKVLEVRPGITDLASIEFINENEILAKSNNPEELYINEIMPQKLTINLNYIQSRTILKDMVIIFLTVFKVFR
jgi:lipopolysaccharide/colanic/teichoic acid biosynthesis glycosyltransferase